MNSKALLFYFISFLIPLASVPAAQDAEFVELARSAKAAVLLLLIRDGNGREVGSGTGFFISRTGQVATNFHVIEHADDIEAELADGRKIPILGWLAEDKINDIAILQADFTPSKDEVLPLVKSDQAGIEPGEHIFVIGAPKGLAGTLSEGIVSAIRRSEDLDKFDSHQPKGRLPLLQITAAISPGSSGSPVIDKNGRTVGIAVSNIIGGQNLNFAVPVSIVNQLLTSIPADAKPHSFKGRAVIWNLLISAAFFYVLYLAYKRIRDAEETEPRRRATSRY